MRRLKLAKLAAVAVITASFFSCKSAPELNPVDAFDVLEPGLAMYLSVPVQPNIDFVTLAVQNLAKISENDARKITERLETAYIAVDSDGEIQLSASGNIPTAFVGLALREKNGWKGGIVEQQTVYTHQQTQYQLCLPSSSNAFLSRKIEPMVKKYNDIAFATFQENKPSKVEAYNLNLLSSRLTEKTYRFLHEELAADIKLYSPKPQVFTKVFLGSEIGVPVNSVFAELSQYQGVKEQFNVKLILNLAEARTVKATIAMMKIAFFGSGIPAKITQTGPSQITIIDLPVTQEQIFFLIR
ncbi:hypothetical protein [uncultured Treponema sp.]|uniref:hypothetical protein n=1 Tax=uncultured Treponema sp. TaxID=162155 RepID=UPI0025F28372|nr:hypothetical protein [uncultured Treponema sp.]